MPLPVSLVSEQSPVRILALVVGTIAVVAVVLGVVGPVLAHGNHAAATAQTSANGTLRVEQVFLSEDGYLVVHRDDGGQPGAAVGSRPLEDGLYTDLSVRVEPSVWANVSGNVTLWVTVHASDGDGQFEPESDGLLSWFGRPAGDRITVGKRDAATALVTGTGGPLDDAGRLPVTRVVLGQSGHVVVHRPGEDAASDDVPLGPVVGHRTLAAGVHTDVRVPLTTAPDNRSRRLGVVVYTDDGDGQFDDGDRPLRVGDTLVASPYSLQSPRPTPTVAIRTPSPTDTTGVSPSPTDGETSTARTATAVDGPGFGPVATLAGVLVVTVVFRRRRR